MKSLPALGALALALIGTPAAPVAQAPHVVYLPVVQVAGTLNARMEPAPDAAALGSVVELHVRITSTRPASTPALVQVAAQAGAGGTLLGKPTLMMPVYVTGEAEAAFALRLDAPGPVPYTITVTDGDTRIVLSGTVTALGAFK